MFIGMFLFLFGHGIGQQPDQAPSKQADQD
jgi:hypothetical protein